jgi:hypothetical protein
VDVSGHLSSSNDCGGGPLWPFVDGGWALIASVCRSSSRNRKKHQNRTERNRKQPDHRLRLPRFAVGSVAGCLNLKNFKKP